MINSNRGIVALVLAFTTLTVNIVNADVTAFTQYYEAGQNDLNQGQYSSAIVDFRKALRINYLDNSARIGLINSYLARATYYVNQEKNYEKAANDFRSAVFYLKIYPTKDQTVQNSAGMISTTIANLNQCLKVSGFDTTAGSRYKKAEELRAMGNFSAASFEFLQASANEKYAAKANEQIADLLKLLGNEPRAVDYYQNAINISPNDGLLRMKYARTLDKIGQYDQAVGEYNKALANSKGDMEVLYALERIYMKKLAETPSDAELNANLGAIKQAQGDFDAALSYYGKAEQINPSNVNTRLNVGTLFQQKKEYDKALKSYDSVLTLYPDNVQANLYKAQVLAETGNKEEAINLYKRVLTLEPNNEIAKSEMIGVMQSTMSPEEYITYLSQHATDKTTQNLLYDYAVKLHKENQIVPAITAYKAVINADPTNANAYVNLAICYAANEDYSSAVSTLNSAKVKFPTNSLVLKTLKDVQSDSLNTSLSKASDSYNNKDFQKAIEQYMAVSPATVDSLMGVAASYQALENYSKAVEYYKKAEQMAPTDASIPYYIGYLYSEQKKWVESEGYLRKSLKLDSNSDARTILPYVIENRVATLLDEGMDAFDKKNSVVALAKFNEVLKKDTKNAYAYYYRAMIYDDQKKTALAISDYLNVLKYSKEIPIANYMLAIDYDTLAQYKNAYNYYNKFIESYTTDDDYLKYAKSRKDELKKYAG